MLNKLRQKFSNIKNISNYQSFVNLIVLLFVFFQIFSVSIGDKMHQRIPESLDHYAEAISISISHYKYDLKGYVGYRSIYDELISNGFDWYNHTNVVVLNEAINKAKQKIIDGSDYVLFSVGDIGYVDYVSLAFNFFGAKVESLLYLYMVILFVEVLLFFVTFRKERFVVVGLILFLLSHYIIANCLVGAGYNLWTFHNNRFLPVLGLLPIIHICLLSLFNKNLKLSILSGALIQVLIYIFILRCRNSAFWMMGLVLLICGLWVLIKLRLYLFNVKRIKLWPVVLVIFAVAASLFAKPYIMNAEYFSEKNIASHTFWFPVYVGLAINPEIRKLYGPRDEQKPIDSVSRFAEVCDEDHSDDSYMKGKIRTFVCKNRKIAEIPLVALRNWNEWIYSYTQNDQDGAKAVFNWLKQNGKTEEHLYTFGPDDNVGYPRYFGQCDSKERILQYEEVNDSLRKFDSKKDFKWREMDRIMGEVVKSAIIDHPIIVIKTILLVKPFFFLVFYSLYFIRVKSIIGLIVIVGSLIYLERYIKDFSTEDMKKFLAILFGIFISSMMVTLIAYPAKHTISDQSILFTISLLGLILYFLKKLRKK